jgi:hypothetical protein
VTMPVLDAAPAGPGWAAAPVDDAG